MKPTPEELELSGVLSRCAEPGYAPGWLAHLDDAALSRFTMQPLRLSAPEIRAQLARAAEEKNMTAIFVVEAVPSDLDDDALVESWRRAARAYRSLSTEQPNWGGKRSRQKIRAYARSPFLPAIQAAVAGSTRAPLSMLAVLVADGSVASVDALMPRFLHGLEDRSLELDQLKRCEGYSAKTPALEAMFKAVEERLEQRNARSRALEFARARGIITKAFIVRLELHSNPTKRIRCSPRIVFDSTKPAWFSVRIHWSGPLHMRKRGFTIFDDRELAVDQLGLGRCEAEQLPEWLAQAQRTLGVTWILGGMTTSSLLGTQREEFANWLLGPSRSQAAEVSAQRLKNSNPE